MRSVQRGSPAAQAGARVGDRLLALGDTPLDDIATARKLLRLAQPEQSLRLTLQREEQAIEVACHVRRMPTEQHAFGTILLDEVSVLGYRLRAIALLPDAPGPHPTLYYLPGAHWASEEYPFDVDAPVPALLGHLARQGIASLRVERFGMGDSEGPPCTRVGFLDELAAYRAGLDLLSSAKWCDHERVLFWGHSLGAMVAPLLASALPRALGLRGIVTFGASAIPISAGLTSALERHAVRQAHVPPTRVARQVELLRLIVEGRRTPAEASRERPDLRDVTPDHFTDVSIYRRNVAFYHELELQPLRQAWSKIDVPVVALHGADDWICTLEDSERLAALTPRGVAVEVPNTDHHLSASDVTFRRDPHSPLPELRLSPDLAAVVVQHVTQMSRR